MRHGIENLDQFKKIYHTIKMGQILGLAGGIDFTAIDMTQEPYGYKQSLCNWSLEEIRGMWNRYAKLRELDDEHYIGIALFK